MNRTRPHIWRLHLRPDHDAQSDPVALCLSEGIVGIGWRVEGCPATKQQYLQMAEKRYGNISWRRAANAFVNRIELDDLVWTRDFAGMYYLGKVDGEWMYNDGDCYRSADIVNIRKASLFRIGSSVAGKIVACFRPSATIQEIDDETVRLFSMIIYNRSSQTEYFEVQKSSATTNIFSLLSDVDLEDVVGLYLQSELNYLLIPSTRSRDNNTPFVEFYLISRLNGNIAGVQVKSGSYKINRDHYAGIEQQMYLFSPAGYSGIERENTTSLERDVIEAFMTSRRDLMPLSVKTWLSYSEGLQ